MTRILLVDDSDDVRRSVRAVLEAALAGMTIAEAATAGAALAALGRDERWDLVVLDLSLPDRSGLAALREVRRLHPALPVIVMSFNPEAEYAAAARAAGAVGYIAKGSSPEAIASAVRKVLAP